MTLIYHEGQLQLQAEANTRPVAEMLADWVGPVTEFCRTADMIVLALPGADGRFEFIAVSGAAPVVDIAGPSTVAVALGGAAGPDLHDPLPAGGIAISLATARRARLNGELRREEDRLLLEADEAFTNCRKYIAPSAPLSDERHAGPRSRHPLALDDPYVAAVLQKAETSFLATMSPDAVPDVSHRGGPPGFLRLDVANRRIDWDEYVGDGMLKSAGNIRATSRMGLLVPDIESGDAIELWGRAEVNVVRRDKRPRVSGLVQAHEEHPVQGFVRCRVDGVDLLRGFTHPRRRLEKRVRVTSASPVELQAPQ